LDLNSPGNNRKGSAENHDDGTQHHDGQVNDFLGCSLSKRFVVEKRWKNKSDWGASKTTHNSKELIQFVPD